MYETKLNSINTAELDSLIKKAGALTSAGICCPRMCHVDRIKHHPPCGAVSDAIRIASFSVHKGEEPPVSGTNGAGNVFFSGCTMQCVFCQNYPFSQLNNGNDFTISAFADKLLQLQNKNKVHNINLTTSDHYLYELLRVLATVKNELKVPISNNCSGFYRIENLEIVHKVTDIFLFDLKYSNSETASNYSQVKNYVEISRRAAEFYLENPYNWIEEGGVLKQGLIFRHLMLPGDLDNTIGVLEDAALLRDKGLIFKLSLMCQYFPAWKAAFDAAAYPKLQNKITEEEYDIAVNRMDQLGLDGWVQDMDAQGGC